MKEEAVFEFIWSKIYDKLMQEISKSSQSSVAKKLSVGNAQISRWVSGAQKGGTMKTVVKTAVRLGMTWRDFIRNDSVPVFDQEVGKTLGRVAESLSLSIEEIGQSSKNKVSEQRLGEIFQGRSALTVEEFGLICDALGCSADKILGSAAKAVEKRDGKKMVA